MEGGRGDRKGSHIAEYGVTGSYHRIRMGAKAHGGGFNTVRAAKEATRPPAALTDPAAGSSLPCALLSPLRPHTGHGG